MSFIRTLVRPSLISLRGPMRPKVATRLNSSLIKQSSDLSDFQQLIKDPKLTLVDFYADWCGPCKAVAPHIEKFATDHEDVQFLKVDVDEATDIAREYGISAMPTFVFFKDGDAIGKIVGANVGGLKQAIEKLK